MLDVDSYKPEGRKSFSQLIEQHGPLPSTVSQRTGGGGEQFFFKLPDGVRIKSSVGENNRLGPGIDIRGEGGYVVVPPSIHPSGKQYKWVRSPFDHELAEAPAWLVDLLTAQEKITRNESGHTPPGSSYGASALKSESEAVRAAPQGSRNHTLNRAAYNLGQLVGGGVLAESAVLSSLTEAATQAGLKPVEIQKTLQSGLKAGRQSPRTLPPNGTYRVSSPNLTNHGDRAKTLIRSARILSRAGYSQEQTLCLLNGWLYQSIGSSILPEIEKALSTPVKKEISLAEEIRNWALSSPGEFEASQVDAELGLSSKSGKKNRSKILARLVDEGVLERVGRKRGRFRLVDRSVEMIDWQNAVDGGALDLKFPLGLHDHFEVLPGSLIIVAGVSNTGKTAFCLNLVKDNMNRQSVTYFGSSAEASPHVLKKRIERFGEPLEFWEFRALHRPQGNFADVIDPDGLNIIDYLEIHEDFYLISGQLAAIHEKLDTGIAVIALQKKPGEIFARGGAMTQEKASVYLSLDPSSKKGINNLKIIKAKYPKDGHDCTGQVHAYRIVDGHKFEAVTGRRGA